MEAQNLEPTVFIDEAGIFENILKKILSAQNADWEICCLNNLSFSKCEVELLDLKFILTLKTSLNKKEVLFEECTGTRGISTIEFTDKFKNSYLLSNYNESPKVWIRNLNK